MMNNDRQTQTDSIINHKLGRFVLCVSSGKVRCLKELLDQIFIVSAPISCDFVVYEPIPSYHQLSNDTRKGVWRGVKEKTLSDLQRRGYPQFPINTFLEMHNKGLIKGRSPLNNLLTDEEVVAEPIKVTLQSEVYDFFLFAERFPIKLIEELSESICCLVLLNPIHVTDRPNQDKRPSRIHPITELVEAWLAWVNFQHKNFRENCLLISKGDHSVQASARILFHSLLRLHKMGDIINYANKGMLLNRGYEKYDQQLEWLNREIIQQINYSKSVKDKCWHDCLRNHWPPCHEGEYADEDLLEILLQFCPWTSNATHECNVIPKNIKDNWYETVCNRLWIQNPQEGVDQSIDFVGINTNCLDENSFLRFLGDSP